MKRLTASVLLVVGVSVLGGCDSDSTAGVDPADALTGGDSAAGTDGTDGADDTDNTEPPDTSRWTRPDGAVSITFFADDRANGTYADGDIQWTGSFAWDRGDNTIEYASSWLPDEREWPALYDDGPISQGGHEAEGQQAGDNVFSTEVFFVPTEETVFEYGALNEFGRWIWLGPNGVITIDGGATGVVDAGGVTFPEFGDRDLKLAIDLGALHPEFATISADTHNVYVKGTMNSWTPIQILDDGTNGDETAGDGVFTYLHSTKLGPHDGLVFAGQHVQFVFVFAFKDSADGADGGLEYKFPVDALTEGVSAWSGIGELTPESVILEPDSYGKVQNTTVVVSGGAPPAECDDANPCDEGQICNGAGQCVPEGGGDGPAVSLVDPPAGSAAGGTPVTVSGSGFEAGATVWFGDAQATDVTVESAGTITALTPAGPPGKVAVTVVNPGGAEGSYPDAYTYTDKPAPVVDTVTPSEGNVTGGEGVTIGGANFQPGATVLFDLQPCTSVSVGAGGASVTCKTPKRDLPGTVDVTVTNPDGQSDTLAGAYTFKLGKPQFATLQAPFDVTAIEGAEPGAVTARVYHPAITEADGAGPGLQASLGWGAAGSDPATAAWTWVPATWTGQGGDFGNDDVFSAALPATLTEGSYDWAFRFSFDGQQYTYADRDASKDAYDPGQSGTLTVTALPDGLSLTGVFPKAGSVSGGTTVTIDGYGFGGDTAVTFDGTPATSVTVVSNTQLTAVAPAHAQGAVTLSVSSGGESRDLAWAYGLVHTPTIDGTIAGDWPAAHALANDEATAGWDNNDLNVLYAAFDDEALYLAVDGAVEPGNVLVIYLDTDYGAATGQTPAGITDGDGALDNALGGSAIAVTDADFGAEFAVGAFGGSGVGPMSLDPKAGLRSLATPGDLGWFASHVAWAADGVEIRIPLATLGLSLSAPAHTLGVFARIVNPDGEYVSPEGLPSAADADGTVGEVVEIWIP